MERARNTLNKGYIVRKLRERGLSRRRSVQLVNFILDEVSAALACSEDVKFPFGSLQRAHHRILNTFKIADPHRLEADLDLAEFNLRSGLLVCNAFGLMPNSQVTRRAEDQY